MWPIRLKLPCKLTLDHACRGCVFFSQRPVHQQCIYQLCEMARSLVSRTGSTCIVSVRRNNIKCKNVTAFMWSNSICKTLIHHHVLCSIVSEMIAVCPVQEMYCDFQYTFCINVMINGQTSHAFDSSMINSIASFCLMGLRCQLWNTDDN